MPTLTERATELREQRATINEQQQALIEAAEARENPGLTAEERQQDDRLSTEFDDASDELRRVERQIAREADLRRTPDPVVRTTENEEPERRTINHPVEERRRALATDEYRDAFIETVCLGREITPELRAVMVVGVDADGGFTVPEEMRTDFIDFLDDESAIRGLATVITTATGRDIPWPRLLARGTKPDPTAETDPIPETKPTFDQVTLKANKYAEIIKASDEFIQDTAIADIQGFIVRTLATLIGQGQARDFVVGDGVGEAEGLMVAAAVGKTAAAVAAITLDECIDLQYSVRRPYRRNGVWVTADTTEGALRKLKDSTGQFLWQPSVQAGEPDRFLGKPIYADPDVPTLAADQPVLGFGDVRRGYTVRDAGGLAVKYLDQLYAADGEVGWRGQQRSDGRITDQNAFKVMKTHA